MLYQVTEEPIPCTIKRGCYKSEPGGSAQVLGADGMLYQTTEDLLSVGHELNPSIEQFEASPFNGARPGSLPNTQGA